MSTSLEGIDCMVGHHFGVLLQETLLCTNENDHVLSINYTYIIAGDTGDGNFTLYSVTLF